MKTLFNARTKEGNFKHKGFSLLAFIIGVALFFSSCQPDEPQSHGDQRALPTGRIVNTADRIAIMDTGAAPNCWMEGTGCTVPWLYPIYHYPQHRLLFTELRSYADAGNLQGFFANYTNSDLLLPDIKIASEEYNKLINGEHKLHFYSDSSIAIYDPAMRNDNIIHLYKYGK